ncbi:MAG: hypothetical protein WD851_02860 [Pirellulales bacterium]
MATASALSTDRIANYFTGYLCERYGNRRHVRQVATWIGFLLKAIERVAEEGFEISHTRQIKFRYAGHQFKARYSHQVGSRGGIEIVEYFSLHGSPEGAVAVEVTSLDEAEEVYRKFEQRLDDFLG